MIFTIIISAISCLLLILSVLFFPKINIKRLSLPIYWFFPFLGAVFLIAFKSISVNSVIEGLTANTAVNPLKILALFISMTTLSVFLDEVGFFSYLASKVLQKAESSQVKLFVYFYLITSVLTVFTSNDIIILTFTPFICYFSKRAKINPIPYLVSEFVSANTWSMMFIIGNPTNIYLSSSINLNFFEYFKVMIIPTLFGGIVSFIILFLLFNKYLKKPIEKNNDSITLKNKTLTVIGIVILASCTVLLAVSNYLSFDMWIICVVHALLLFFTVTLYKIIKKEKPIELINTLKRAPWILVPFVISMFIIVLALENNGVLTKIANALGSDNTLFKYGSISLITANVINNIPMSVLFSSLIKTGIAQTLSATYSAVIGSNIGAFLTPIGALAGIMWINILSSQKIKFNFLSFIKFGFIIGVPTITASLVGLALII